MQTTYPSDSLNPRKPDHCQLCGRSQLKLTRHHLIPKVTHRKKRTRKQHNRETMLESIAWLCRPCHAQIHLVLTNQQMSEQFHSVEALKSVPEIRKFAEWVAKRPAGLKVTHRRG